MLKSRIFPSEVTTNFETPDSDMENWPEDPFQWPALGIGGGVETDGGVKVSVGA